MTPEEKEYCLFKMIELIEWFHVELNSIPNTENDQELEKLRAETNDACERVIGVGFALVNFFKAERPDLKLVVSNRGEMN